MQDFKTHTNSELINIMNSEHKMLEPLKDGATKEYNSRKKKDRARIAAKKQQAKLWDNVNMNDPFNVGV